MGFILFSIHGLLMGLRLAAGAISFPEPTYLLVSSKTRSSGINILGLSASRRMRGFVYMALRDKVDVDTFHKDIQ